VRSDVALGNNYVAFMFDEIRYKLDDVKIDRNRNFGITSTLKNYVTMSSERIIIARNAGWEPWNRPNGYFNFCIPLNMLLGFCENYRHVVINACHELILIHSRNDNNCLIGDAGAENCIVQSTVANAACVIERNKKIIDAVCSRKRVIPQHGFSLVGSV